MAVPWRSGEVRVDDKKIDSRVYDGGLAALYHYMSATVRFRFPALGVRIAELIVVDMQGKTVFSKIYSGLSPAKSTNAS
jgi:hypothetical protein